MKKIPGGTGKCTNPEGVCSEYIPAGHIGEKSEFINRSDYYTLRSGKMLKPLLPLIIWVALGAVLFTSMIAGSELYPSTSPADWSPGAIASWTKLYYQPKIASGVYVPEWIADGGLPPIASVSVGDL